MGMKVKKTRPVVARVKVEMPESSGTLPLFYYSVVIFNDGKIIATQLPGESPGSTEDNTSTLALNQIGVAIEIRWFPTKPEPDTEARREGLLAIMDDVVSRLPEKDQEALRRSFWGVGHAWGARLEYNEDSE